MGRQFVVLAVVLALFGSAVGFASDDAVPVWPPTSTNSWIGSLNLTDTGGSDQIDPLSWDISLDSGTGIYTYEYTWSGAVTKWILEVSPNKTALSFSFGSGYTATVANTVAAGSTTLATAITFDPNPSGFPSGSATTFSFRTRLNPIYGDVWGTDTVGGYTAYNPGIGGDTSLGDTTLAANFVPVPDSGGAGPETAVPEPSTAILALTALIGGAVARRRKKKAA